MLRRSSLLGACRLVVLLSGAFAVRADDALRFQQGQFGPGELKFIDGLPVLTLEGTPDEMGQQHIRAVAAGIDMLRGYCQIACAGIALETFYDQIFGVLVLTLLDVPKDLVEQLM